MSKIRCYGLTEVLNMRGIKMCDVDDLANVFKEYQVHIFQPPTTPGSGRGRRQIAYYITTNKDFDRWVSLHNTLAILKERKPCKVKYKKYP